MGVANVPLRPYGSAMKIVDVAEYYAEGGGGIRTYIQAKLRAAAVHGHEMIVIAPGRTDFTEEKFGGKIRWVKGPAMPFDDRYGVLWNPKAVHRILDEENPDVVEASSAWAGGQFASRWKGNAVKTMIFHQDPVAVIPHTYLDKYMSRENIDAMFLPIWAYLRRISKRFDATVVSGSWLGDRLASFQVHNPVAVPFGIDKDFFTPNRRSTQKRKELLEGCGQGEDATLFLAVSRFHPEKRLDTVFRAFEEFQRHHNAGLVVYGAGKMPAKAARIAEKNPAIHLAGYTKDREELAVIYASADAMLHGSAAETFGLGVAEALCSGLPVIAPSVGGAADLVPSDAGALYEPGNAKACAEAALDVISRPREELLAGTQEASRTISTVERHFEELFAVYQEMVDRKKSNESVDKL